MKPKSRFASNFGMRLTIIALALLISGGASSLRAGSLWREAITDERGMYADKIARRVGDIVTIVISESAISTNAHTTTTAKDSAAAAAGGLGSNIVGQFITGANEKLKGTNNPLSKFPLNILPRPNAGVTLPTPSTTGASTFTGGGEITNSQRLTSQMAVQVVDRLPNGNLVIEGIRQVAFSKERQFAALRGIIRPYDISRVNTVASSAVADARIDIVSEGALSTAQKKGWLLRFDEKISPY
jgi:flagellar L-ring protein precursor FlgH